MEKEKDYNELKKECKKRNWEFNNFTAFVLESHLTASRIAYLMNTNPQTCYHWTKLKELPGAVNFIFLIARKMRLMGKDLFSYV